MKLWDKGGSVSEEIERFTVGQDRELDRALAPWDVLGTLAHSQMLCQIGLLPEAEWRLLRPELLKLYAQACAGGLHIEPGVEDIHSQVELMLTRELGETGKKVHAGRSRNDQVLVDLKLFFLGEIESLASLIRSLFDTLQRQSEAHRGTLLPGYTHFQIAMPSSFGLWFGAYAECLAEDLFPLYAAWQTADQNPLGSAAGYGNSFPLDRHLTTRLLGFSSLSCNAVAAQMGRGKTERALAAALAAIGATLNKLSTDVCLYMSQNFGFLTLPAELTTGSSIMPHKKNPDVFELIRARSNRLQALPALVSQLTSNLPSGYHRDFQLLKEYLFPAIEDAKDCLRIAAYMLERVQVQEGILDDPRYDYLFTVEAVNREVMAGLPFREAYRKIGAEVEAGTFRPDKTLRHTHAGSIGDPGTAYIAAKLERAMAAFPFAAFRAAIAALTAPEAPSA